MLGDKEIKSTHSSEDRAWHILSSDRGKALNYDGWSKESESELVSGDDQHRRVKVHIVEM